MSEKTSMTIAMVVILILTILAGAINRKKIERLNYRYQVVCGSLNDCCRNMIDYYQLPDSIYNQYLDVIQQQGFDKNEVKHLYFSY